MNQQLFDWLEQVDAPSEVYAELERKGTAMYLDLLTPEDFASHLKDAAQSHARYAQVTQTKGGQIPVSEVTLILTAPIDGHIARFKYPLWYGAQVFMQDEAEKINARSDAMLERLRSLGLELEPGPWLPTLC